MRVLVVEDLPSLAELLCDALKSGGFSTDWAPTLNDADAAVDAARYDAFLLDRVLPDGDGLDWLKARRRAGCCIPALIVTAERWDVSDRIEGLNAGADDYVSKPFVCDELIARLRAVLRRPTTALEPVLRAGNVEFDPSSRQVWVDTTEIHVPRRESCILESLMRHVGRVVPKTTLETGLYGYDDEVSMNAIEVGVYRLRVHLQNAGATVAIRTVRGTGYCLEEVAARRPSAARPAPRREAPSTSRPGSASRVYAVAAAGQRRDHSRDV